jgi:uncharacterized membrane protein
MNLHLFWESSPVIIIHTICAFLALGLGIAMYGRQKGTRSHKIIGRIFAVLMLFVATSAIFIKGLNGDKFSFIHIFVIVTYVGLFQAFYHIRKKDVRRHKKAVAGLFFGALLIPGIVSFFPGRLMWVVVFG